MKMNTRRFVTKSLMGFSASSFIISLDEEGRQRAGLVAG